MHQHAYEGRASGPALNDDQFRRLAAYGKRPDRDYLGFPHGISGEDLTGLAMVQALKFGVRIYSPCAVAGLDLTEPRHPAVLFRDGSRIETRAVIAATGARYRCLPIAGLARSEKAGRIRYAATELDARGYEDQPVAVVGGANSAGQAALSPAAHG